MFTNEQLEEIALQAERRANIAHVYAIQAQERSEAIAKKAPFSKADEDAHNAAYAAWQSYWRLKEIAFNAWSNVNFDA
jgi:hypothetical protein